MQSEQIEKLKKQVERYEAKGYKDTAAHQMLASLQKKKQPAAGATPQKRQQVKQEAQDGE